MESFPQSMRVYKKQLEKGHIQKAYQGLMAYFRELHTHFRNNYPEYAVPGTIYYGYMDMTYFPVIPQSFKLRKLKAAVVFIHDSFRFEVWLSGSNRKVQETYWELFKEKKWKKYRFAIDPKGEDYIIGHMLIDDPDFSDLNALTRKIEKGTTAFISDVENFLSMH